MTGWLYYQLVSVITMTFFRMKTDRFYQRVMPSKDEERMGKETGAMKR